MNLEFGLISIIAFLIILTPIVFVHELGHFWFARIFNVNVEIFSIGFGPVLFSYFDSKGTKWQIASIPIGGFVKMQGELNINPDTNKQDLVKGSFQFANPIQRLLIVLAGPVFNFLLSVFLIAGIYFFFGKVEIPNEINDIVPGSSAEIGGMLPNDKILTIKNINVKNFEEIRQIVIENPGVELEFKILRDNKEKILEITPEKVWSDSLKLYIGKLGVISSKGYIRQFGLSESIYNSLVDTLFITQSMIRGIGKLFSGNVQQGEIGGPVKIAELSGQALVSGVLPFIFFGALISLNLGLVNLLPIPALDGGHIMLYLIEIIFGKPLPSYVQNLLMRGGITFLLFLMIVFTINDIIT